MPDGWRTSFLGEVITSIGNGSSDAQVDFSTAYPVTRIETISTGEVDFSRVGFLEKVSEVFKLSQGDILLSNINSVKQLGKVAFFDSKDDLYHGINLMRIVFDENQINKKFGFFLLGHFKGWFEIHASQAINQASINQTQIKKLRFTLPEIPEQKRIVSVLETWDKAIKNLTKKIETKKKVKKGLTQNLLTGKIRLVGFKDKWTEPKFGELFSERNERGVAGLPLLSITADRGVIYQSDSNKKDTSNADKSKYLRICPGDIGYNTMRMWQGRNSLSKIEGLVSPAYTILKPNAEVDSRYFAYLFKTPKVINYFFQKSQGLVSDTWQCRYKDFAIIRCRVPSYREQSAIADVLETADIEIQKLEEKLSTLKAQKRYLLNNLITGAIRTPQSLQSINNPPC